MNELKKRCKFCDKEIVSLYLKGITPNEKIISQKITKEIFAADIATEIAKKNKIPFRSAYKQALKGIKKYKVDLQQNINSKISLGAAGNLDLNYYKNLLGNLGKRKMKS